MSTTAPAARRPIRTTVVAASAYLVAALFLLPYLDMALMAARPKSELTDPTLLPHHYTLHNFTSLWSGDGLGGSIVRSLVIAGGATLLVLLVALPAAYYTARHRFLGRTAFLLLVLATQMFQPAAMLVGLQRQFSDLGLPPTLSLVVINAGFNLAFAVWILNAFFAAIPVDLEEAAMVDGLSRVGAMVRITLPLAALTETRTTVVRDGRRRTVEIAAVAHLGQRDLNRPVATVDHQHLRLDPGDRPQRLADLAGLLDLVMEDIGMLGAEIADARELRLVAGRLRVGQESDAAHVNPAGSGRR